MMEINILDVIQMVAPFVEAELLELVAIGDQLTTPDGRWEAFQEWLRDHPRWRTSVDKWMQLSPEAAYSAIKQSLIDQSNNPKFFQLMIRKFVGEEMQSRIIKSIETLQILYRERAGIKPRRRRKEIAR